jgi:Xaa-Pro aminopeptidase
LSHPEPPYFVPESDEFLVEGDVVALEPGLFVAGVGGMRFEHNYLVTASGYERLTNHRLTLVP